MAFSFNIKNNTNNKSEIFITDDSSKNELTLSIKNKGDNSITFKSGDPVKDGEGGPSSFYLYFGSILRDDEIENITISSDGWQVTQYDSDEDGKYISLSPSSDITLESGKTIDFSITKVMVTGQPKIGNLNVDYGNIEGIEDDSDQIKIIVSNPPSDEEKDLTLSSGFSTRNTVFITKDPNNAITNRLVFYISNPNPNNPIVDNTTSDSEQNPVFNLSFVNGKGPGALASANHTEQIEISIDTTYENRWKCSKNDNGSNSEWQLTPQTDEILGTGDSASVSFSISNIITEIDYSDTTTLMYIQYANIPGYNDGFFTLEITKTTPQAGILSFTASQHEINEGNSCQLSWQTFAASKVELSYNDNGMQKTLSSANGDIKLNETDYEVSPTKDTTYTLIAYDNSNQKISRDEQETITVIEAAPSIISFKASQNTMCEEAIDITLTWETESVDNVVIDKIGAGKLIASGSQSDIHIDAPCTITLTAYNDNLNQSITKSIKIARKPEITCERDGLGGIKWSTKCKTKSVEVKSNNKGVVSTDLTGSYTIPDTGKPDYDFFRLTATSDDDTKAYVYIVFQAYLNAFQGFNIFYDKESYDNWFLANGYSRAPNYF